MDVADLFAGESRVTFLDRDFSCIEYNELVKRFDFVIASRYHSIIHAYKNGVPCIAIGWAVKYNTLLESFGQEQYCFDLRKEVSPAEIIAAMKRMTENRLSEKERILKTLELIQKENVFDIITAGNAVR